MKPYTAPDAIFNLLDRANDLTDSEIVISLNNEILASRDLLEAFAKDVASLCKAGAYPIIVHEGYDQVEQYLDLFQVKSDYFESIRITNQPVMDLTDMVVSTLVNKAIVTALTKQGINAVGISGRDAKLIEARKIRCTKVSPNSNVETIVNLGFVGEPALINPEILVILNESEIVPVISPIALGTDDNKTYRLHGDEVACAIASALLAAKLVLYSSDSISEFKHILRQQLLETSSANDTDKEYLGKDIGSELGEKLAIAAEALENQIEQVHILPSAHPHALLMDLLTEERVGAIIQH